jgi:diketogulonate reductase-like aldo/keto reductase
MPNIKLSNNLEIPIIGFGTNGLSFVQILEAIQLQEKYFDYIMLDTAINYGTEKIIGKIINNKIPREKIFISTKVEIYQQIEKNICSDIRKNLKRLNTDYIDLLLIHWPLKDHYINTYKQMETLINEGLVKSIGVCNCNERYLGELLENCKIRPVVNQIEFHPLCFSKKLLDYCKYNDIQIEAYSPLCKMIPAISQNKTLIEISQQHNKSVSQIILRWHIQNDIIPIFKSTNKERIIENIHVFDFFLHEHEMAAINNLSQDFHFFPPSICCPGY